MAFVKLNNRRVPISSIKDYRDCPGISKVTGKPYCTVKIYSCVESFYFDTEEEKQAFLLYLDKALKVVEGV